MRALRPPRVFASVPIAVLVIAATVELVSVARYDSRSPAESDWRRAVEIVGEKRSDGDLIVFAPGWIDPVGRHYFGQWIPVTAAGRMDAAGYSAIWEVSLGGQRAADTRGLDSVESWRVGELVIRRYEQSPTTVLFDFGTQLRSASIAGDPVGRPSFSLQEVGFEPHQCVRVEPRPGQEVTLRFGDVPLGSEIVGYAGLADVFTRRDIRTPAQLAIEIDGDVVGREVVAIDSGWKRFAFSTPSKANAEVVFRISATEANRLVCFAAEVRR